MASKSQQWHRRVEKQVEELADCADNSNDLLRDGLRGLRDNLDSLEELRNRLDDFGELRAKLDRIEERLAVQTRPITDDTTSYSSQRSSDSSETAKRKQAYEYEMEISERLGNWVESGLSVRNGPQSFWRIRTYS